MLITAASGLHPLTDLETSFRLTIADTGDPTDLDTVVRANWPQLAWTIEGSGTGVAVQASDPTEVPFNWTLVTPDVDAGDVAQPDFTNATNERPKWFLTEGQTPFVSVTVPYYGYGLLFTGVPMTNTDTGDPGTGVLGVVYTVQVWMDTFAWRQTAADFGTDAYYAPCGVRLTGTTHATLTEPTTQEEIAAALTSPWVADEGFEVSSVDSIDMNTLLVEPYTSVGTVTVTDEVASDGGFSSFGGTATLVSHVPETSVATGSVTLKCVKYYDPNPGL